MFKKHIIFQIMYVIVGPLCTAYLKHLFFYKVPPSDKHSLLWLANWHSALWLAEHHKPRPLSIIASTFKMNVMTVNNVLSRETMFLLLAVLTFIKNISLVLGL